MRHCSNEDTSKRNILSELRFKAAKPILNLLQLHLDGLLRLVERSVHHNREKLDLVSKRGPLGFDLKGGFFLHREYLWDTLFSAGN